MSNPERGSDQAVEQALRACLRAWAAPGESLLIACSGGIDSLVLLDAAAALSGEDRRVVAVAHLNHNLRGSASEADAALVRRAAKSLELDLFEECLPAGLLEQVSAGSLEASARAARLSFLLRTAQREGFGVVLTAHHAGDQAETVLHNILRGTGLKGLRGIPVTRKLGPGIRLLRPFLAVPRRSIEEYAERRRIVFAVDQTNSDIRYTRNRIRHELLPQLRQQFNPSLDEALRRLGEQSGELLGIVDGLADELLARSILQEDAWGCRLDAGSLAAASAGIVRHAFVRLWDRRGWGRQHMGAVHWHRVAAAVHAPGTWDFPGGIRLESTAGILRILVMRSESGKGRRPASADGP